jgi:hypothetical protein
MDASLASEKLGYEEQALAFAMEGLVNEAGSPPT